MRFLKTARRGRALFAHRTLESVIVLIDHLAELTDAIGAELGDPRWTEASNVLAAAAVWCRAPYDHKAREKARRDLPTSVPLGSELGAPSRRDELAGEPTQLDLIDEFYRRRDQRKSRPPAGVPGDARRGPKRRV